MKLQERTRKKVFIELCRAQQWTLEGKPVGQCANALARARAAVAKNNNISMLLLKNIEDEGVEYDWPEGEESLV